MLQVIDKQNKIRPSLPSPGLQLVPCVFAFLARVGVGPGEDFALPGFDCGGLGKPLQIWTLLVNSLKATI